MQYRQLGKTNLKVSVIGFGGVPITRVSQEEATETLHSAFDLGVNFIDTARSYSDSEEKIGKALAEYNDRDKIIIATKARKQTAEEMAESIEESLQILQTDYIDLYQVHDLKEGQLETVTGPGGAIEALQEAKEAGKIGHIGLSGHRPNAMIPAIRSGHFATAQIPLNIIDYPLFKDNIPAAQEEEVGLIIMKPLCGGLMESAPRALRFVLSHPVSTAIPGMDSPEEVQENVAVGQKGNELTETDMKKLEEEAAELGQDFCRRCGYCEPCPAGIAIPDIFRFDRYYVSYFSKEWAKQQYEGLAAHVPECIDCAHCEEKCPYQLPIRDKLQQAHEHLSGENDN